MSFRIPLLRFWPVILSRNLGEIQESTTRWAWPRRWLHVPATGGSTSKLKLVRTRPVRKSIECGTQGCVCSCHRLGDPISSSVDVCLDFSIFALPGYRHHQTRFRFKSNFFNCKLQTPPNKVARILTSLSHDGAVGGFWTEATYSHGIHGIMSTRSTG